MNRKLVKGVSGLFTVVLFVLVAVASEPRAVCCSDAVAYFHNLCSLGTGRGCCCFLRSSFAAALSLFFALSFRIYL